MPHYLLQASYTGDGWKAQVGNPQDAISRLRGTIEGLGGKIESAYYSFGDDDVVAIIEFPDNITAASFSVAGSAGVWFGLVGLAARSRAHGCLRPTVMSHG